MLLLVGAVLILVAARAGGSRAIGIAPPGAALRLGAATAGLLCVVAAVILMSGDGSRETPGPADVAITNELGPQQLSEEIRVFIDGRHVGVLKVDPLTFYSDPSGRTYLGR
jgi:hypothetical protein